MPLLATLVATLFGSLASFLASFMVKKAAFAAAAVITFGALTVALLTAVQLLVAGMITAFPASDPIIISLVWVVLPDNAAACIAAMIATDSAVALYRWNAENVRLVTGAG